MRGKLFLGPPDHLLPVWPRFRQWVNRTVSAPHLLSCISRLSCFSASTRISSSPISSMRLQFALAAAYALLPALSNCSTLTPPVLPLIVRNPYLSTWLGNARDVPWNKWPMFWTGQEIGFSVLASVPESSQVYPLLGRPQDSLLPVRHGDG